MLVTADDINWEALRRLHRRLMARSDVALAEHCHGDQRPDCPIFDD